MQLVVLRVRCFSSRSGNAFNSLNKKQHFSTGKLLSKYGSSSTVASPSCFDLPLPSLALNCITLTQENTHTFMWNLIIRKLIIRKLIIRTLNYRTLHFSLAYVHMLIRALFLWRDSNDKLSASHSLGRLSSVGMLVNTFLLDQTASSSEMYFLVSFKWIYC